MPATNRGPRTWTELARGVATAALLVLAVTACQPPPGPAGTVTDRDRTYKAATKQWEYALTVRRPDRTTATFKVTRSTYRACPARSAYPTCTED
ncbi:hypothetical protein ACFYY3_00990 [Streptomyces sp. NPDC001812]|uniref:hypothetical protein n=1 Tax=Streptomyces sp. NPDC001812 TaxID=3364611 RepID=UPI003677F63B